MSFDETLTQLLGRLTLPPQNLNILSFCHSTKAAPVKIWAESLPATRISFSSVQLYTALPEIARLNTDPNTRLDMLESVRPYVQQCIQGLGRNFLNQPIILPEGAVKTAIVAQALQKHITNGYIVAARDIALQNPKGAALQQLDLALHRAINGLAYMLMRGYQLYTPVPNGVWLELHTLFAIAQRMGRSEQLVTDSRLEYVPATTLRQAYLRPLLLACARPNQLRQQEVQQTFEALELWTPFVYLKSGTDESRLFAIDTQDDLQPIYKDRLHPKDHLAVLELDLEELVTGLKRQLELKDDENAIIRIPSSIPTQLIEHLCACWTVMRQRAFERRLTQGELEVTVGLTNLHYYCAGDVEFHDYLANLAQKVEFASKPTEEQADPWASSVGGGQGAFGALPTVDFSEDWDEEPEEQIQIAPTHRIKIIDTSPGGYCLNWNVDSNEKLRAGDILGVREPGRIKWAIAAVRWIRQSAGLTQLGVQVIAPQAQATALSMVQRTGENTPFMRALRIQALKSVNQPSSLITDSLPFVEYCKVRARDGDGQVRLQLTKRLFATGSISQFTYRVIDAGTTKNETGNKRNAENEQEDYSSVWKDN